MKTVTVADMKKSFSKILRETSAEEEIIVTKHGQPVARFRSAGEQSLTEIAEREAFWKMLARRAQGPSTPIDDVWDRMGVPKTEKRTRQRGRYPRSR